MHNPASYGSGMCQNNQRNTGSCPSQGRTEPIREDPRWCSSVGPSPVLPGQLVEICQFLFLTNFHRSHILSILQTSPATVFSTVQCPANGAPCHLSLSADLRHGFMLKIERRHDFPLNRCQFMLHHTFQPFHLGLRRQAGASVMITEYISCHGKTPYHSNVPSDQPARSFGSAPESVPQCCA